MATRTISTRLVLEGEAEYRAQLKNVNAELSLQRSELARVESQYRSSANTMEALQAKGTALQSMYEAQQTKLGLYASRLEAARNAEASFARQAEESRTKLAEYQSRLAALQASTEDTSQARAQLTAQIQAETKALDSAEASQQKAANSATYYQRQVNQAQVALDDLNEQLSQNQRYLDEAASAADHCATSIDQYGNQVKNTGDALDTLSSALAAAGVAAALQEIAQALHSCVDASIEFESAVTGVYKTVEGTPEQLQEIADGIKQMATEIPATTTEIAAVAEAAGQLGIATDDVLTFTRVMLDLGESTNLSADEAATALARFANITGTSAADYERLGSVIVGLGNNFATTEAEITEMAQRLASAGTLAGMSEAEILALAAAMSSVGIEAEAGGTAMTQTLNAIESAVVKGSESVEAFAQIAGMSAEEFAQAWESAPAAALQAFISGLGELEEQGESSTLVLDELGLSGVRQSNMLRSMALAADTMTGAVELANQAWSENTALAEEANKRYATTESRMQMMRNAFDNVQAAIGDALSPALGALADAGTEAFSWAADFIEQNPWLVQAITGVVTALGVLTGAVTALMVIQKLIPILQAFNAALAANPVILVASAIAGLVVAIGTMIASADDATVSVKELTQASRDLKDTMEEAQAAYEETTSKTLATADAAQTYIDRLRELESLQTMTDAQAKEYSNTVALLVNLMPELSEYVVETTDAFGNVTFALKEGTDAIAAYVDAYEQAALQTARNDFLEQYRTAYNAAYTEMYQNQVELAMVEAEIAGLEEQRRQTAERVMELQEKDNLTQEESAELYRLQTSALGELTAALGDAHQRQAAYTEAVESSRPVVEEAREQILQAEEAMAAVAEETSGSTDTLRENRAELEEDIPTWEELQTAMESATDTTRDLASAQDTLADALSEQEERGSLSLDTTLELIDAGYAAALAIDEETGAITLNREAYIAIAQAKIDEQIATLKASQASVDAALAMKDEALMATDLGKAYLTAAEAKSALEGQRQSYQVQIAALEQLRSSIGQTTISYTSAANVSSSASRRVQTQAEKDLAAYKELQAELEHQRNMDELSEAEYYQNLAKLRDRYLTDEENLDEYRKVTEQIYQYDKDLADAEEKLWEEQSEALLSEYEDRLSGISDAYAEQLDSVRAAMDELEKEQSAMAERLSGYGELFTVTDDRMSLNGLQEQIDAIRTYGEVLEQLRSRGISDSLLGEVTGMDVDEAVAYGQQLLSMSEEQWENYNSLWEEKQAEAKRIAEEFYQSELDTLQTEYDAKLAEALDALEDTAFLSGQDTVQGLIDGMTSREEALLAKARELSQAAQAALSATWGTGGAVDGSHAGGLPYVPYDGYIAELHEGERVLTAAEAKAYIARSMPNSFALPQEENQTQIVGRMLSQAVNTMAGNRTNTGSGDLYIDIPINGTTFCRAILRDFRTVSKANPEVVSGV